MGCDIHFVTEVKKEGKWEGVEEDLKILENRNYSTFAFLANVRNSFGTKGFEPKGSPEDMSDEAKKLVEEWDDGHSHSYLTLQELIDKDKTDYCSVKCKILKDFYDKFIELGGVIPEGMSIEEDKPQSIMDCFRFAVEETILVKWEAAEADTKNYPIFKIIEELKEIANIHSITDFSNIRIVFFFDN